MKHVLKGEEPEPVMEWWLVKEAGEIYLMASYAGETRYILEIRKDGMIRRISNAELGDLRTDEKGQILIYE